MSSGLIPNSLERFLEMTSDREQVIATNMANIDTPGYRTKDLKFSQVLTGAGDVDDAVELNPVVSTVPGLMQRPDGNDVDLDRESLLLAQTQLQYQMGTQLIKSRFHQLLSAINGGN